MKKLSKNKRNLSFVLAVIIIMSICTYSVFALQETTEFIPKLNNGGTSGIAPAYVGWSYTINVYNSATVVMQDYNWWNDPTVAVKYIESITGNLQSVRFRLEVRNKNNIFNPWEEFGSNYTKLAYLNSSAAVFDLSTLSYAKNGYEVRVLAYTDSASYKGQCKFNVKIDGRW